MEVDGSDDLPFHKRVMFTLPETNISLKIDPWKRRFLLETTIIRGYVGFQGCRFKMGSIFRCMSSINLSIQHAS